MLADTAGWFTSARSRPEGTWPLTVDLSTRFIRVRRFVHESCVVDLMHVSWAHVCHLCTILCGHIHIYKHMFVYAQASRGTSLTAVGRVVHAESKQVLSLSRASVLLHVDKDTLRIPCVLPFEVVAPTAVLVSK